ncbi:hypothetical protein [Kiloniella sp.]|uniref:hypothetical protein n=1 Tax=Kiloniella sp. TaxID=1938587 RepID=UPI003B021CDC
MFIFFSPFLAPFSQLVAISFLLVNAALWIDPEFAEFPARAYSGMVETEFNLNQNNRIFGAVISSIHLMILSYGLWSVAKIFNRLNTGKWYLPEFGQCLRRFGLSLVLFTLMIPVVQVLMSLALTYNNEVGERMIQLDLDASTAPIAFVLFLIGILLSLMSAVLVRAGEVAEEYEKIV